MPKKKYLFISVIAILTVILLAIAGGIFLINQNSDEDADAESRRQDAECIEEAWDTFNQNKSSSESGLGNNENEHDLDLDCLQDASERVLQGVADFQKNNRPEKSSNFGMNMALQGDVLAVQSQLQKAVYIFEKEAGGWIFKQELSADILPELAEAENFGGSLALDGEILIVGASYKKGAAYIFEKEAGGWIFKQELSADTLPNLEEEPFDFFGRQILLNANTLIIGAEKHYEGSGAVYIFEKEEDGWIFKQELSHKTIPELDEAIWFGTAIAVREHILAISASLGSSDDAEAVYVFEKNNGQWHFEQKLSGKTLLASRWDKRIQFGTNLAFNSDELLVEFSIDVGSFDARREAYILKKDNGLWVLKQKLSFKTLPEGKLPTSLFDNSLALGDDMLIFGSSLQYDAKGVAYIFQKADNRWSLKQKLLVEGEENDGFFGHKVVLDAETLIVSGLNYDNYQGAVFIFKKINNRWILNQELSGTTVPTLNLEQED